MPFNIITTNSARRDIQQAIDWENHRKPGLANLFLNELNKKIKSIAITPGMGSVRYNNVRIAHTKTFLYNIHYTVNDALQYVIIVRVLHSSREPIWQ